MFFPLDCRRGIKVRPRSLLHLTSSSSCSFHKCAYFHVFRTWVEGLHMLLPIVWKEREYFKNSKKKFHFFLYQNRCDMTKAFIALTNWLISKFLIPLKLHANSCYRYSCTIKNPTRALSSQMVTSIQLKKINMMRSFSPYCSNHLPKFYFLFEFVCSLSLKVQSSVSRSPTLALAALLFIRLK